MRFAPILAGLLLTAASLGPAVAQSYADQEVSVNPVPPGGGVLLYPGGQYMRVVRPLLQPGETASQLGPIRLHPPSKTRARTAAAEEQAPAPRRAARPRPARVAEAPSPPVSTGSEYSPFRPPPAGLLSAPPPAARPAAPAPAAPRRPEARAAAPKPVARTEAPKQVARAEPPRPAQTPAAPSDLIPGLTKRSVILFAPDAPDPAKSALGQIKYLAGDLAAAMTGPASRVQLQAYGGAPGDKGSDARRLSLKRALAIRQVLIDDGVPSDRIDVHAEGGVDDGGPADRVDVYIKT